MSGGCWWGVSIKVGENVIGRLDVGGLSVWVTRKDDRGGGDFGRDVRGNVQGVSGKVSKRMSRK